MSKSPILLACNFPERLTRLLRERYDVHGPMERSAADAVPPGGHDARALLTMGTMKTDRALLDVLPKLGLVSYFGTGYEGIDLGDAAARRLSVTHSPGANASSVADFAMGLVIASARQILAADRFVRDGRWRGNAAERMPSVPGLTGARLGIYGYGAIGSKVAARAAAFEMEIAYHSRTEHRDIGHAYKPSLIALAEWADILVVSVRADASNRHAVNRAVLAALGPKGHLINISRGMAVDTAALIEALENGTIAGAGLDVFENEPEVPARLIASPRVVLTPHIASASISAREAQEDMILANLDAFFAGRPVVNPVPGSG
ncbi:2-hydroxyacid dehydrogenase [Phreatobacter stygius]|uniref:2-hydroxyacid dehydrogenase n=1 Tax=Phreatobacter stygius TaxID=1940610 RepID=A0A4D7B987_9HYPH|nr:2-hydroxyacid dehydrogenase [Phreatobacter stygius]QCI67070.1 2-hydroxyacid dehydrogenase [Phreatobacter stygius]